MREELEKRLKEIEAKQNGLAKQQRMIMNQMHSDRTFVEIALKEIRARLDKLEKIVL